MKLSDFLSPSDVIADLVAADKQKLLLELAQKGASIFGVRPDHVFAELTKREELGSTGMGDGVAIPHARFQQVTKPYGMLVRLKKPLAFDAVDGKPVDIVFLLLLPETAKGEQLSALALIARKLRDPAITAALRHARDSAEMYRALATD